MNPTSLTTQIHRAVFALPLLAIALAAAFGAGTLPAAADAPAFAADTPFVAVAASPVQGAAATLPAVDTTLGGPKTSCDAVNPVGARGLARMPGDISTLAGRLRCAQ